MKGNKLEGRPGQIFNMDESGMPLDPKAPRLIFQKGSSACALGSGDKSQITIVACASAVGFCLRPMVIWDHKTLAPELAVGEVSGTIYGLSSKGWIDCELFDVWFNNHFLRYIPSARPVLLLLDGVTHPTFALTLFEWQPSTKFLRLLCLPIPPISLSHWTKVALVH